jgi:hypothetical protein
VELIPVKAFTPYGVTSSSAIYSAFEYAVQNGARIIVAAWASKIKSRALEDALRLARDHDVLVVTSSGEDGVDLEKSPQYPASFKKDYANVVVAGAYGKDGKVRSNFGDLVDVFVMTEKLKVANPRGSHFKRTENSFGAGVLAGAAAASFQACKSLKVQDFVEVLRKIRAQTPDITRLNLPSLLDKINQDCKL